MDYRDDVVAMHDWTAHAGTGLKRLRRGTWHLDHTRDGDTLAEIAGTLAAVERLDERLDGLRQALIRAHYDAGGSHGELAAAMDTPRPTAQTRGDRVRRTAPPTPAERWATGELAPCTRTAGQVRPGWTLIVDGHHLPVSEVAVDDGGQVQIHSPGASHTYDATDPVSVVARDVQVVTTTEVDTLGPEQVSRRTVHRRRR